MSDLDRDHQIFDQLDEVASLMSAEKWEEAEKLLLEVYNSVPHPKNDDSMGGPLFTGLAAFYEKAGQPAKALPILLKETDYLETLDAVPHCNHFIVVGRIYFNMEELDKARRYFQLAHKYGKTRVFKSREPEFLKIARMSDQEFESYKQNFSAAHAAVEIPELSEQDHEDIEELCEQGNEAMDKGQFQQALALFNKALAVLPEPKDIWEASGWIYVAIGDAQYMLQDYEAALAAFAQAYKIYGPEGLNPFILLRLGQCHYHCQNKAKGLDFLLQAYMMDGEAIFEGERKYLMLLKKHRNLK